MTDQFDLFDANGIPDGRVDIDALTLNALRVAGRLAIASQQSGDVAEIIRTEIIQNNFPPQVMVTFAALVVQELTVELFAPLLTVLQVEHLDTDFTSQLQQRSGLTRNSRVPQHGDSSSESEH